jgi:hypothetical protein
MAAGDTTLPSQMLPSCDVPKSNKTHEYNVNICNLEFDNSSTLILDSH